MALTRLLDPLVLIAERLGEPELRNRPAEPGVNELLRLTIYRHDGRTPDSIATLRRGYGNTCRLDVRFDRDGQPLHYEFAVPLERYQKLAAALRQNRFDTLDDQPDLPFFGADLWRLERVSGSFYRDIIFSPREPRGHYRELMLALKANLPEAVREVAV